ncbi:MAG: NRDE family protein [Urechidicola sp.]|nr:NRDE family protein [Urechidicola sp.]
MCTVTFLPLDENEFILTSSRDVPFARKRADSPKKYIEDGVEIIYPKDGDAGGSWIGTSSKNRLICLLNGGYKNHIIKESYRKSRGIIVKDLLKANAISETLTQIDLDDIEPFTLVIVDWNDGLELFEFVWTGEKKHLINIPQVPHIWSSSTLYDDSVKKLRQDWFRDWNSKNYNYSKEQIINFHKTAGVGNPEIDVLMKREKGGTVSITCISRENAELHLIYEDMLTHKIKEV